MTPGEHCTSGFHGPGYTGPGYAASLAEFGRPHALPASGGWVLEREIPGSAYRDAMGPYPLFSCTHWDGMAADLADLETTGRVSLTLVTDPWCGFEPRRHGRLFSLCRPYKPHHVLDMEARGWSPSVHHQRETRRAERQLRLEWMDAPGDGLDAWWTLYGGLTERLGLTGIRAFSRTAFRKLFALPGVHLALAWRQDRLVGGQVLLVTETVAYATSPPSPPKVTATAPPMPWMPPPWPGCGAGCPGSTGAAAWEAIPPRMGWRATSRAGPIPCNRPGCVAWC